MNGVIRLMWTYLYRCQDPLPRLPPSWIIYSNTFSPPNRLTIFPPQDDGVDPLIYITHFVLSRHFDYGRDLCFELLQESAINSHQSCRGQCRQCPSLRTNDCCHSSDHPVFQAFRDRSLCSFLAIQQRLLLPGPLPKIIVYRLNGFLPRFCPGQRCRTYSIASVQSLSL